MLRCIDKMQPRLFFSFVLISVSAIIFFSPCFYLWPVDLGKAELLPTEFHDTELFTGDSSETSFSICGPYGI